MDIVDLIYQVFDQIKQAEKSGDFEMAKRKERELDSLRAELADSSKKKGYVSHLGKKTEN